MKFENLTPIQTNFGTIYIEDLNPEKREEPDRIKVYDTYGRYIDYCPVTQDDNNIELYKRLCEIYEYADYIEDIFPDTVMYSTNSWEKMLIYMLANNYFDEEDKQKISRLLTNEENFYVDDFLLTHDLINIVGEYYILVKE